MWIRRSEYPLPLLPCQNKKLIYCKHDKNYSFCLSANHFFGNAHLWIWRVNRPAARESRSSSTSSSVWREKIREAKAAHEPVWPVIQKKLVQWRNRNARISLFLHPSLAFTRYCITSRLYCLLHNNILRKHSHSLYCAIYIYYCTI